MSITNSNEYGPRDLVGYGEFPPDPRWPSNAKVAVSLVLNYEEGSELAPEYGDGVTETAPCSELGPGAQALEGGKRNVNMESFYEYGSRAGVWRMIRMFDEYDVPFSLFACAEALKRNQELVTALDKRRERVELVSHAWRWIDRSRWTAEEERENVGKAIQIFKSVWGKAPVGWFYGHVQSAAGDRSRSIVANEYKRFGVPLAYYSDDYSDDLPFWVPYPGGDEEEGLLILPYSHDCNDYKFGTPHGFVTGDQFAQYCIDTFDELLREGKQGAPKMMTIGLHARMMGRPGRAAGLRKIIEHMQKHGDDVWFATREQIAEHWTKEHPFASSRKKS